jgi:hypothetical protein
MEIKGTVVEIGPIESGQGKKDMWHKQTIVLKTIGEYPKTVAVMYWNAMTDTITQIGQEITAHVNAESRSYNGRWYTELRVWKTEKTGFMPPPESRRSREAAQNSSDDYSNVNQPTSEQPKSDLDDDSLPF